VNIDDGGITGAAFYSHVRRIRRPVLASPKRHNASIPPSLGHSPVVDPAPLWTWSLLHRADDDRAVVRQAVASLLVASRNCDWTAPPADHWWIPSDDPHRNMPRAGA